MTKIDNLDKPDAKVSVREIFNINSDIEVISYSQKTEFVPDIDENYHFDLEATLSIIAGFNHNKRVLLQGYHGTGKSSHIEQIAARLNWPCVRINLDGNISRMDLVGRDSIVLENGQQVTKFKDGIIPWSIKRPVALVFDEYDAATPDVLFVLQRLLEQNSKFTLLDTNEVLTPHPYFRIFATANTVGTGNISGIYHGTQPINQGQMDRWNIVSSLNYLPESNELKIILSRVPSLDAKLAKKMINLANLTRKSFEIGDLSTVMSPRTLISWAENYLIFKDIEASFKLSFLNKCDNEDRPLISEYYQRCFAQNL